MNLVSDQTLDVLLPTYPAVRGVDREEVLADTAKFLRGHIHNASLLVQAGLAVLSLAFRCWMLLGRLLGWDPVRAMERWEALTGDPGRSFLRLVRSLAVLSYLEHPYVLRRLGMAQLPDQQALFRQKRFKSIGADRS